MASEPRFGGEPKGFLKVGSLTTVLWMLTLARRPAHWLPG